MPAHALDVDRDAVKAHAIQHGVREAARAFGLPESTVKSWSTREGWLKGAGLVVQPLPKSMQPRASNASKPSEAAVNTMQRLGEKTKTVQAKAVLKGSRAVAAMPGPAIVERADRLLALVNAGAKLHGSAESGPSLGISLSISPAHAQVVDVEATVRPVDDGQA